MAKNNAIKSKLKLLKENRTLNPNPEKVKNPLFREDEFFDPNDMIQVKYEMIRKVRGKGSIIVEMRKKLLLMKIPTSDFSIRNKLGMK